MAVGIHKRSWLARYFTSYLMIGVLPVLVLGMVFYYANSISMEREVRNLNYASLTQSLGKMDYLVEEMTKLSYNLSSTLDTEIGSYMDRTPSSREFSLLDENMIEQYLASYEQMLSVPMNAILFMRGDSYLYTSEGKVQYAAFEERMRPRGDLTMSSFYTSLCTIRYNASLRISASLASLEEGAASTVYLYPIPYMDLLPTATLGFIFSDGQLQNLFENYLGGMEGNLYIYNEYLSEIYCCGELEFSEESREAFSVMKGSGVFEQKIEGKNYVVMRCVSENSGFSFVMVTPRRIFYGRMRLMQGVVTLSVLALLVIGVVLAYAMSRSIYRPVKRLVDTLYEDEEQKPVSNEFEMLQGRYRDIANQNIEMSDVLDRQRPMVAYSCLDRLLRGKFESAEELAFSLKCARVDLSGRFLFVMLLSIAGASASSGERSGIQGERMQSLLSAADSFLYPGTRIYALELAAEKQLAVLVNIQEAAEEGEDVRKTVAEALCREIERECALRVRIGVGRVYAERADINASFMEASVVLTDYMNGLEEGILLFEEVTAGEDERYRCPVIEQALFIQSLKQADEQAALKALDEMVGKLSEIGSFLITQCLCFDIINMMLKLSGQLGGELKTAQIKELCTFGNLEEFHRQARKAAGILCCQLEKRREESGNQLKNELIDYVNLHFCDSQLSLESLAEHFELSPNYISRFFKQETGYNFIQYVSFLRMERVKEELETTDLQIKEIVYGVGYMDVASFVRKFKAYEGVTPGQYRERVRARETGK